MKKKIKKNYSGMKNQKDTNTNLGTTHDDINRKFKVLNWNEDSDNEIETETGVWKTQQKLKFVDKAESHKREMEIELKTWMMKLKGCLIQK